MIVILEGPDKCGKSSFLRNLNIPEIDLCDIDQLKYKASLTGDIAIHSNYGEDITIFDAAIAASDKYDIYLDRSFISEMIYGPIFRDKCEYSDELIKYFIDKLRNIPHVIMYFHRPLYKVILDLDKDDPFECDITKYTRVHTKYRDVMEELSDLGLNVYLMNFDFKE
ncbi:MAG: hypothetical protein IKU15_00195 [Clostridia bacterium]|nr:hypothetical protein [Clostridia bacterium]